MPTVMRRSAVDGLCLGAAMIHSLSVGCGERPSETQRLAVYLTGEIGVSPGVVSYPRQRPIGYTGDWAVGGIWNMSDPSDFKGLGLSATWPAIALKGLCNLPSNQRILKFACRARGRASSSVKTNLTFGFSAPSGPGFAAFGNSRALQTNALGWSEPLVESTAPAELIEQARNLVNLSGANSGALDDGDSMFSRASELNGGQ